MILTAMHEHPERIAEELGSGHWLLRGLAGSGKTAAIMARARHTAHHHPDWRILLVCFNPALASRIATVLSPDGALEIRTLHDWLRGRLSAAGIAVETRARGKAWDQYWTYEVPKLLVRAIDDGRAEASSYQAILVDEGQDFGEDCYRALLRALDRTTNHLVIAVDPLQNVYDRTVQWSAAGVDVGGHVRLLPVDERNARPFLSTAIRMVAGVESAATIEELAGEHLLAARRRGQLDVARAASFEHGRQHALDWIRDRLARGVAPEDIMVLGLSRLDMITVNAWLNSQNIAAWLIGDTGSGRGVRVSTIHGCKGLDADHVLLLDAHLLETREPGEARRLLYIALTRSDEEVCVTALQSSRLVDELEQVWRAV